MAITVWPVNAVAGAPAYSGRMLRQAGVVDLAGATAARPLGARSGVRPGTPSTTIAATSVTWTVKPHAGVLDVQTAVEASAYRYSVDADVTGAMTPAHATLPRKDILYVQLSDPAEGDGTPTPMVSVLYLAGTAATAGTEVPPTLPARSMRLGVISVPMSGGGAPTTTFDAPYMAAVGAPIWVRTQAERDLLTPLASPTTPIVVERLDAGAVERNVGSGWADVTVRPGVAYTPVLTAATTNPALGSGAVASGRYVQVGKLVTYWFNISFGTTGMSPGSGTYSISLPVTAAPASTTTAGAVRLYDSSTGQGILGARAALGSSTTVSVQYTSVSGTTAFGALGNLASTAPWTWAPGDIIDGYITYEAA